jgi:hypothetical protein
VSLLKAYPNLNDTILTTLPQPVSKVSACNIQGSEIREGDGGQEVENQSAENEYDSWDTESTGHDYRKTA